MKNKITLILTVLAITTPTVVSAGLFDGLLQGVAKDMLDKTVSGAANSVVNKVVPQAAPTPGYSGLPVQNGCYTTLPAAADTDRNGCVDQNEAIAMQAQVSAISSGAAPQSSGGGLFGALSGAIGIGSTLTGNTSGGIKAAQAMSAINAARQGTPQTGAPTAVNALNGQANMAASAQGHFMSGDVLKAKIGGVRVHSDSNNGSKVIFSLSKGQEVIFGGAETNGFVFIQSGSGDGWVSKTMLGKNGGAIMNHGASGNYMLTVKVTTNAFGVPPVSNTINNVAKPANQTAFCSDASVQAAMNQVAEQGGTLQVNSCSFNGTTGRIVAILSMTSPMPMTMPYTIDYSYN